MKKPLLICFNLLLLSTLMTAPEVSAGTVSLESNTPFVITNHPFPLELIIEDTADLYGIAFDLVYDADALQVQDSNPGTAGIQPQITEGSVLNSNSTATTFLRTALKDKTPGTLVYGHTRSGNLSGVDISTPVTTARLFWVPLTSGTTILSFTEASLKNSEVNTIADTVWNDITLTVYSELDSDSDGMSDEWEIAVFGDTQTAGASSDYDSDGYSDYQEYLNMLNNENDPSGNDYDPKRENAPGGTGYLMKKSINLVPIYHLLLFNNASEGSSNTGKTSILTPVYQLLLFKQEDK
ncbi:MAG: hypothetical protein D3918_06175 [Candidatus Electrothrix sp. AX2]|nr:hypothetical protein [Candidatus Electrothrix gigas]